MRAIDMHVHVPRQPGLPEMVIEESLRRFFRLSDPPQIAEELAIRYKEWDIFGVVFSVDAQTSTGDSPDTNDYVAELVNAHPEQFIGFATVDPWKDRWAVNELDRAVNDLGLRGLKLQGLGGYNLLAQTDARCPAGQVMGHHLDGQPSGVGGEASLRPTPYLRSLMAFSISAWRRSVAGEECQL